MALTQEAPCIRFVNDVYCAAALQTQRTHVAYCMDMLFPTNLSKLLAALAEGNFGVSSVAVELSSCGIHRAYVLRKEILDNSTRGGAHTKSSMHSISQRRLLRCSTSNTANALEEGLELHEWSASQLLLSPFIDSADSQKYRAIILQAMS